MTLVLIFFFGIIYKVHSYSSFQVDKFVENCMDKEVQKDRKSIAKEFKLLEYSGYLDKSLQVCLESMIHKYPKKLTKALIKKRIIEREIIKKKREMSDYHFSEKVTNDYRTKDCQKEVHRYYPKKIFFHSIKKVDKEWSDNICLNYLNLVEYKKSP